MRSAVTTPGILAGLVLMTAFGACRPDAGETEYLPRDASVQLLREAAEAFAAGDTEQALQQAEAAVEEDPGYYLAHSFHSLLLGHLGRHEDAAAAMQKALAIEPDYGKGHLIYGVFMERAEAEEAAQDAYTRAIEAFDAELAQAGDDPELRTYRAVAIYLTQGRVRGQAAIDKVLADYPGHKLATSVRENMRNEDRQFFLAWAARTNAAPAAEAKEAGE